MIFEIDIRPFQRVKFAGSHAGKKRSCPHSFPLVIRFISALDEFLISQYVSVSFDVQSRAPNFSSRQRRHSRQTRSDPTPADSKTFQTIFARNRKNRLVFFSKVTYSPRSGLGSSKHSSPGPRRRSHVVTHITHALMLLMSRTLL